MEKHLPGALLLCVALRCLLSLQWFQGCNTEVSSAWQCVQLLPIAKE